MSRWPRWIACACVALPALVVELTFAASGVASLLAERPLVWPIRHVTLAEAVALRDRGEVARQIMLGANPNARYITRNAFRENETVSLTALEAAVVTRERYMVGLVADYGALIDETNAATLQCLAAHVGADEITRYLVERSRKADCTGVALPWSADRVAGTSDGGTP